MEKQGSTVLFKLYYYKKIIVTNIIILYSNIIPQSIKELINN